MTEEAYNRMLAQIRARPSMMRAVLLANKLLTYAGYLLYPLLLLLLAFFERGLLLRSALVPSISFVLLSAFRRIYNAPRPYEVFAINPLIHKDTSGKSFPSRHTFCMFIIAATWLLWAPGQWVGILLTIAGVLMAAVRVLSGIHFPRDVIAGALIGIACACIGYFVIPWP